MCIRDRAIGFHPGQTVTFLPYFNCSTCIACRQGKTNCCASLQVCGVHIDGGMVEYLSVPSGTLIDGTGLNYDELALVEPLACLLYTSMGQKQELLIY